MVDTPEKKEIIVNAIREELDKAITPDVIMTANRKPSLDSINEAVVDSRQTALVDAIRRKRTLSREYSRSTSHDMTKLRIHVTYW